MYIRNAIESTTRSQVRQVTYKSRRSATDV